MLKPISCEYGGGFSQGSEARNVAQNGALGAEFCKVHVVIVPAMTLRGTTKPTNLNRG